MRLASWFLLMLFLVSTSAFAAGDKADSDPNSLPATGSGKTTIDSGGDCD
jgi:hypothetical protein